MKKLFLLAIAAAGAVFVKKRMDEQQSERDLWAEATDSGPTAPGSSGSSL